MQGLAALQALTDPWQILANMALVRVLQKVKQLLQLPVYLAANRPAGALYTRAVRTLLLLQMSNNASLATQEREKERMSYVKTSRVERERKEEKIVWT